MIYITGDCHGRFGRFMSGGFSCCPDLTENDTVIVCGDLGLLWAKGESFEQDCEFFAKQSFTLLWVQGNHENYNMIDEYPVEKWHGGKVRHIVRDKVILLERGQVFDIEGKRYFTFGGAQSHDISGGVLDKDDPLFEHKYNLAMGSGRPFRILNTSWWKQELPTDTEIEEARVNLESCDYKVDYVITHCASNTIQLKLEDIKRMHGGLHELYAQNILTDFFEELEGKLEYSMWYFGHYHEDMYVDTKHRLIYYDMVPVVWN